MSDVSECQHVRIDHQTGLCFSCNVILDKGTYGIGQNGEYDYDDIKFTQNSAPKKSKLYPVSISLPFGKDIINRAEEISELYNIKGNRKGRLSFRRYQCLTTALREKGIHYDPEHIGSLFDLKKSDRNQGCIFTSIDSGYRPNMEVAKFCDVHPGIKILKAKAVLLKISDEAIEQMINLIKIALEYKPKEGELKYSFKRRKPTTMAAASIKAYLKLNPAEKIDSDLYNQHIKVSQPTIKEATIEMIRAYNSLTPF